MKDIEKLIEQAKLHKAPETLEGLRADVLVAKWVPHSNYVETTDTKSYTEGRLVYEDFATWCKAGGLENPPSHVEFGKYMPEYFGKVRRANGVYYKVRKDD